MGADKLNEAADNHAKVMGDIPVINSTHAFKAGADWLMAQPLADRLTDEEKQRIRIMLDSTKLESLSTVQTAFQKGVAECLDAIFGKDLFNDNPEMLK